ncbi:hypothetical protein ElyMa_005136300 [Elysia marginata]|uniref:G-protein coupled receptors family 1 profile domain-containing protein n=1 Tax=Elysia marginata TaxID=1093978 RepID=A0AAV4JRJ7_9GAST|nr:hypothetical protein ElyMa_005136300 [Elysia marginata]
MAVFVDQGPTFTHHSEALFLVNAFSSLSLLNALANPVIYIWRFEMVRKETLQILGPMKGLFSPCCKRRHEEKESEMVVSDEPAIERNRNSQCSERSGVDTASTRVSAECSERIFRDFSRSSQDYVTRISQDKGPDFGMSSQDYVTRISQDKGPDFGMSSPSCASRISQDKEPDFVLSSQN